MKLLFICRSFHNMAGGIERMAIMMMNEMCARGHNVSLLTWDQEGAEAFYEMDDRIKWYKLASGSHHEKAGVKLKIQRMLKFRKIMKKISPDVAMAFQQGTFLSSKLYSVGLGISFIAAERESPGRFDHLECGKHRDRLYQYFRLADKITVQCKSYIKEYPAYLHSKIVAIPNPVKQVSKYANPAGEEGQRKKLLCVGRLGYQKNQTVLIRAFSKILEDLPEWDLVFAGDGEDRKKLEDLVKELNLQGRVGFLGAVKNVSELYTTSHLSCLPALWEGFPNAVAESMAHGLPVVGFKGCMGMSDLIDDGVNGALADGNNNDEALSQTLNSIMEDDDLRVLMGKKAIEAIKKYEPSHVFDQLEALFKEFDHHD